MVASAEVQLVREMAAGDNRAASQVARIVQDSLTAGRYSCDIQQETLLRVWKYAERFDGRCRLATWVTAIARYLQVTQYRRESRRMKAESMAAAMRPYTREYGDAFGGTHGLQVALAAVLQAAGSESPSIEAAIEEGRPLGSRCPHRQRYRERQLQARLKRAASRGEIEDWGHGEATRQHTLTLAEAGRGTEDES